MATFFGILSEIREGGRGGEAKEKKAKHLRPISSLLALQQIIVCIFTKKNLQPMCFTLCKGFRATTY